MPLESATYISDLNTSNPVGSTDKVQTLDDHVRLIKSTIKTTFPSVAGAVTATHAELNILDGVTLTAAQINDAARKSVVNTFTGSQIISHATQARLQLVDPDTADTFSVANDNGTTYLQVSTALDFYIASTVRLHLTDSASTTTVNGITVSDFARQSQGNTFTNATQAIVTSGGSPNWSVTDGTVTTKLYAATYGQLGTTSNHALEFFTNNTARLNISNGGNFDFKGGTVTTNDASAAEVGFKGAPTKATLSGSSNTSASNAGGAIHLTSSTGTFTLDSDLPTDSVLLIVNRSGSSWTIAASGTLTWAATGGTGSRTLADKGMCVALHIGSGNYYINGGGLT